ncbi:MAG: DUF4783 domain-containing protein [Ferruginibacter sp.]
MKHLFTFLAVSFFLSSFTVTNNIDEIVAALKAGNATQIAKYFDNTVEIALPDKSNSYSKSQGEMILKDFFSNSPVKSFEILHKGENSGSQYFIGTLVTSNGTYRTTVFMKQKGDKQTVQEIRFEPK